MRPLFPAHDQARGRLGSLGGLARGSLDHACAQFAAGETDEERHRRIHQNSSIRGRACCWGFSSGAPVCMLGSSGVDIDDNHTRGLCQRGHRRARTSQPRGDHGCFRSPARFSVRYRGIDRVRASILDRNRLTLTYLLKLGWQQDPDPEAPVKSYSDGTPLERWSVSWTRDGYRASGPTPIGRRILQRLSTERPTERGPTAGRLGLLRSHRSVTRDDRAPGPRSDN